MTATLVSFAVLLVVACACSAIAQAVVGYSRDGLLASIVLGFVGALLGMWVAHGLGLPDPLVVRLGGQTFTIIWLIAGSALFVAALYLVAYRPYI